MLILVAILRGLNATGVICESMLKTLFSSENTFYLCRTHVWIFCQEIFLDFLFEIFCLDFLIGDKNVLFALYVRGWMLVGPHTHPVKPLIKEKSKATCLKDKEIMNYSSSFVIYQYYLLHAFISSCNNNSNYKKQQPF